MFRDAGGPSTRPIADKSGKRNSNVAGTSVAPFHVERNISF
jgi:hypothetical protein